ncbi:putative membrane protein [Bacteroides fragilis str. 2-F-2 |nr:putative membrane protein [Bacteroides fragilis str. 2-F-2 \
MFPDMSHTFADFFCGCGGLSLDLIYLCILQKKMREKTPI